MTVENKKKKKIVHFQLHEKQAEVFNNDSRFRVVVAGRRFGKTKLSMLEIAAWATRKLQKIWYVAPTYRMAKQIMWNDLKSSMPREWISKIRENELSMELRNGSKIELRGADKPDSLRGVSLDFLVIDEFQDIDPETWKTVLRPTLADRKGHALFIGCVKEGTKVIGEDGLHNIEHYKPKRSRPKQLSKLDKWFYGIDKRFNKAAEFYDNGVVETRKITTRAGFQLEASLPHPVWTMDEKGVEGWKSMKDLQLGDRVAIDRGMEQWGTKSILDGWPERLEKLVSSYRHLKWRDAYRVPEITENTNLFYFMGHWLINGEIDEKIARLYLSHEDSDLFYFFGERTFGLDLKFQREHIWDQTWWIESRGVVEFIKFMGLDECQRTHHLPDWLWSCPRKHVAAFLSGIWDACGHVSPSFNSTFILSDYREFLADLQLLLTNFGIISTIEQSEDGWMLFVRYYDATLLKDILQLRVESKESNLDIFTQSSPNKDIFPAYELLREMRAQSKGGHRKVLLDTIYLIKNGHRKAVTYDVIRKVLEECKKYSNTEAYKKLEHISRNHYYWDKIVDIEKGEAQTYDFVIPNSHSFWSNGFISHNTPKGFNELYKLYRIGQNPEKQAKKQWHSWQFPTITSPFIPKAEIEAARRDMDEKSFRQEFLASFESMSGRVYYAFDRHEHIKPLDFNPKLPIWVGMDFNIDPMSMVIMQPQPNGQVWAVDEIVQTASNTDEICAELEKRYYKYQNLTTIYPDPAGSARQHARGESDLDIIREHGFKRIKMRRQHSPIADRVNAVNRMLKTASGEIRLYIDPKCKHLIQSFEQTLYIPNSRDVDKSLGVEHSADAAGYCLELEFPLRKFTPVGFSR